MVHLRPRLSNQVKGCNIDFCVDFGGLNGTVAKNDRDFLQRCSLAQHGSGRGMSQNMSGTPTWTCDFGSAHRSPDNHRHRTWRSKLTKGWAGADEQFIADAWRPAL